jgi:hypothetical protein
MTSEGHYAALMLFWNKRQRALYRSTPLSALAQDAWIFTATEFPIPFTPKHIDILFQASENPAKINVAVNPSKYKSWRVIYALKIFLHIVFSFMPTSPKWFLALRVRSLNFVHISLVPPSCYIAHIRHSSSFYYRTNMRWREATVKLLVNYSLHCPVFFLVWRAPQ